MLPSRRKVAFRGQYFTEVHLGEGGAVLVSDLPVDRKYLSEQSLGFLVISRHGGDSGQPVLAMGGDPAIAGSGDQVVATLDYRVGLVVVAVEGQREAKEEREPTRCPAVTKRCESVNRLPHARVSLEFVLVAVEYESNRH